jgi:predicted nucleic acid-binding protein
MTGGKAFFDTNVLLYMYSTADSAKQVRAKELFRSYAPDGRLLLSTQVVQEFYVAGLRKLGLPRRALHEAVAAMLEFPHIVIVGPAHILSAMSIEERYQISFWDALIVAAAESCGSQVVFTEDLNHGQQYGTVTARNPFRAA